VFVHMPKAREAVVYYGSKSTSSKGCLACNESGWRGTCIASKVSLEVARMACNHRIIRIDDVQAFKRTCFYQWRMADSRY